MDNVIIDMPERIGDDIKDFMIDTVEDEKNYTVAKIKLPKLIKERRIDELL